MIAQIEINGSWVDCTFLYPNQEPPMLVAGPMGTTSWQQSSYSRFNAKLAFIGLLPTIPTGLYKVRSGTRDYVFDAQKAERDVVWGSVE